MWDFSFHLWVIFTVKNCHLRSKFFSTTIGILHLVFGLSQPFQKNFPLNPQAFSQQPSCLVHPNSSTIGVHLAPFETCIDLPLDTHQNGLNLWVWGPLSARWVCQKIFYCKKELFFEDFYCLKRLWWSHYTHTQRASWLILGLKFQKSQK